MSGFSAPPVAGLSGQISAAALKTAIGLDPPSIIAPAYANSWVNYGSGVRAGGYFKTGDGMVQLCGTIKSGTVGAKAFTVPSGMRPSGTLYFTAYNPNAGSPSFLIEVQASGDVIPQSGVNTACALDGIGWLAEA